MANLLTQTIEQISREKGLDPQIVHEALEDAMVAAANKYFKTEEDLQARFDPDSGTIDVFAVKKIVEEVNDSLAEMSLIRGTNRSATVRVVKPTNLLALAGEDFTALTQSSARFAELLQGIVQEREQDLHR